MKLDKKTLNTVGGGIIVAAAFLIMMPGLIDYVWRLGRMFLIIFLSVLLAGALVYGWRTATKKRSGTAQAEVRKDTSDLEPEKTEV